MLRIQLNNEWLDTYTDESVQLSWTAFRFQKELRSGFTNDMSIPKTQKNLSLLGAVGLLDSQTQMFGTKTIRCIVQIGLVVMDMMLQVAGLTDTEIKICLYEDCFPDYFKGKTLNEFFVDNQNTIFPWNHSTRSYYSNWFKHYYYGMRYNPSQAQYHPVKPLRDLLMSAASAGNYTMPMPPNNWMLMATKKTVCPQNLTQVVEFNNTDMDSDDSAVFNLHGGQHITNDLSFSPNPAITFNRNHVFCTIKLWVVWAKETATTQNKTLYFRINGQNNYWVTIPSTASNKLGCVQVNVAVHREFNEGDTISFRMPDVGKYRFISCIAKITYTTGGWYNYISKDDYGQDLEYIGREPAFRITTYNQSEDSVRFIPMDGNTKTITNNGNSFTLSTERLCFSYFGYYCNLPEIKMCDLWHSLQWLQDGKLSFDHQRLVTYESANDSAQIEGLITETRPKSDKLGQKNYVKFQKQENVLPVCSIPNEWLEAEVTLHQSIFSNTYDPYVQDAVVNQYKSGDWDEDMRYWDTEYSEPSGPVLVNLDAQNSRLKPIQLYKFGLNELKQSVEVDITTYTPFLRNKDIVYLDGRRYLVISGKTTLGDDKTELKCLLFPKQQITEIR